MNGYPGLVEPFVCKTFWLSHIAYWISTLFYNTLLKRPLTSRNRYEESFHLILLSASLFACKSVVPMIVCVVVPHSVLAFTKTLALICELARADNGIVSSLNAIFNYMSVFEALWILAASCAMCCYGGELPILLRMAGVLLALWNGAYHLERVRLELFPEENPPDQDDLDNAARMDE